jgi:hypothetical protein
MTAYEFLAEKPLPSLPASPTLTNPDMVLPDLGPDIPSLPNSPPRNRGRPPSPSYLRAQADQVPPSTPQSGHTMTGKKEKRGLMSRKMMLLRSRTGSALSLRQQREREQQQHGTPRSDPSVYVVSDGTPSEWSGPASSPTLMDVGNLAPEQPPHVEERRMSASGSSFNSEEMNAIPSFLAKYDTNEGATTGDELSDAESPAPKQQYGYSVSIEGGYEAQRRQQEEDEQTSALLSKRAEAILANAKKRLNVSGEI